LIFSTQRHGVLISSPLRPQRVCETRPVTRGAQVVEDPLAKFAPPLEKCVGHTVV